MQVLLWNKRRVQRVRVDRIKGVYSKIRMLPFSASTYYWTKWTLFFSSVFWHSPLYLQYRTYKSWRFRLVEPERERNALNQYKIQWSENWWKGFPSSQSVTKFQKRGRERESVVNQLLNFTSNFFCSHLSSSLLSFYSSVLLRLNRCHSHSILLSLSPPPPSVNSSV